MSTSSLLKPVSAKSRFAQIQDAVRQQAEVSLQPVGSRSLLAWQGVSAPLWVWTDVPRPALPERSESATTVAPAGNALAQSLDAIRWRLWFNWITTLVIRAITLTLIVGILWQLLELAGGPLLRFPPLLALAIGLAMAAFLFGLAIRPNRTQVARMLDSSFMLRERVSTALENIEEPGPSDTMPASMPYLQIADATNAVRAQRNRSVLRFRFPSREFVTAISFALLFATLFFLRGTTGEVETLSVKPVPEFTSAAERFVQEEPIVAAESAPVDAATLAELQALSSQSTDARKNLGKLAGALDDHAVTQSIADAINRGDYAKASELLSDLAANVDDLSGNTREGLADDLQQASSQMTESGKPLSDAASQAASGLQSDNESAAAGLDSLAESVAKTANSIASPEELREKAAATQGNPPSASSGSEPGSASADEGGSTEGEEAGASAPGDASAGSGQDAESSGSEAGNESGTQGEPGAQSGSSGSQGDQPSSGGGSTVASDPVSDDAMLSSPDGSPSEEGGSGASGEEGDGGGSGGGAGGGQQDDEAGQESGEGGKSEGGSADNNPPTANTTPGEPDPATGEGKEAAEGDRTSVEIEGTDGGDRVKLGGSQGSTVGSGAGAAVTSGNAVQGEVGAAGPDSNHVPPEYRSIVQAYFEDPEER